MKKKKKEEIERGVVAHTYAWCSLSIIFSYISTVTSIVRPTAMSSRVANSSKYGYVI